MITVADILTATEEPEFYMYNKFTNETRTLDLERTSNAIRRELVIKEIYDDCGICCYLKFNKNEWRNKFRWIETHD